MKMPGERTQILDEGQVVVRLDWRHLPDLDDLMLRVWQYVDNERSFRFGDDPDDEPTRFATDPEPKWQWAKISPCWCGEHGWHWDALSATTWPKRHLDSGLREGEPDMMEDRPRGRFIAIEFES